MTWRYQIIQHKDWFGLHEVYLDENGNVTSWTEDAVSFVGDTRDELIKAMDMATNDACILPVFVEPEE